MLYEHSLWTFYQVQKMVDMQWAGIIRGDAQDAVTLVCFLFGSLEYADTQSTLLFKQFIFSRKFSSLFKKNK